MKHNDSDLVALMVALQSGFANKWQIFYKAMWRMMRND